jgi:hypothetical protein
LVDWQLAGDRFIAAIEDLEAPTASMAPGSPNQEAHR